MHIQEDEAFSIFHSQKPLNLLYAELAKEANPPLYFTLLHFWIELFGIDPVAVKSLSALFSVGAAYFIFLIGRRFGGFYAALLPSALFLLSNIHFDFSHMVRAFSLVFLLSSISIYLFLRAMEKPSIKGLVLLTIVNALLPYTHYTSVLLPLTEFLVLFYVFSERNKFLKIAGSIAVSAVLFIPQLLKFKNTIPDDNFWLPKPTANDLDFVLTKLTGHEPTHNLIFYSILISLVLVIINRFYPVFKDKFNYKYLLLFVGIYFIPIYLNYFLAQYTPVFRLRYMLFAGIGPLLAIGYLMAFIRIPNILKVLFLYFVISRYHQGFNPINRETFRWDIESEWVTERKTDKSLVYIAPAWRVNDFGYYFDRENFSNPSTYISQMNGQNIYGLYGSSSLLEDESEFDKLIFIRSNFPDPENSVYEELISRGWKEVENNGGTAELIITIMEKDLATNSQE